MNLLTKWKMLILILRLERTRSQDTVVTLLIIYLVNKKKRVNDVLMLLGVKCQVYLIFVDVRRSTERFRTRYWKRLMIDSFQELMKMLDIHQNWMYSYSDWMSKYYPSENMFENSDIDEVCCFQLDNVQRRCGRWTLLFVFPILY